MGKEGRGSYFSLSEKHMCLWESYRLQYGPTKKEDMYLCLQDSYGLQYVPTTKKETSLSN